MYFNKIFKIILVVFLFSIMASSQCFAARKNIVYRPLNDSSGTALLNYSLTSESAVYSEKIDVANNVGFNSLLITEDKSGGAGDVDISAEYCIVSCDIAANWHVAYTSNMSGAITAEGNIVTAIQNVTRWIIYTPRISRKLRYKFDPDSDSQITVYMIFQDN